MNNNSELYVILIAFLSVCVVIFLWLAKERLKKLFWEHSYADGKYSSNIWTLAHRYRMMLGMLFLLITFNIMLCLECEWYLIAAVLGFGSPVLFQWLPKMLLMIIRDTVARTIVLKFS